MRGCTFDLIDLVLGRECVGCTQPGSILCAECRHEISPRPRLRAAINLSEIESDLRIPVVCSLDYRGPTRQIIYRYKDHHIPELSSVLAAPVMASVTHIAHISDVALEKVYLVPMPSRKAARRRRGFDPVHRVSIAAARRTPVRGVRRLLVDTRDGTSTKKLGAFDRERQVRGAFSISRRGLLLDSPVIIIDDVVTTGSTATEAVSALVVGGIHVIGVATIAGTP